MSSSAYAILRSALINRQQVVCSYHGFRREICPHVIGWKDGREHILVFQFGGQSQRGLPLGGEWRCLDISEISDIRVQPGPWYSGTTQHHRPQSCVDTIDEYVPID